MIDFKGEVENPYLLLNDIEHQTILDILLPARSLDAAYGHYLKPNPYGIYSRTKVKPLVYPGQKVYRGDNNRRIRFRDILKARCNIVGKDGEIIIPLYWIKNQKRHLSTSRFFPVAAFAIIRTRICEIISENLSYVNTYMFNYNIEGWFIDDISSKLALDKLKGEGELDNFIPEIIDDILGIAKDYPWNIYDLSFKSTNAYISRLIDYRIFDWTRQRWNEQAKDEDE